MWVFHGKDCQMTSRSEMLQLHKRDVIPTKIAEHFNFTACSLISPTYIDRRRFDNREETGKNRFYSLRRRRTLELVEFFEYIYDYNLKSSKGYVKNKEKKK
jgi:hypothetical protein